MSALAHWLEEAGIATSVVALVRDHAQRMAPPRSLWVPFELGRPLGPPNRPEFQRRVLEAALGLLDSATAPGTITDFPDDDPERAPDPDWAPPDTAGAGDLMAEVAALRPAYDRARARFGRTTVGVAGVELDAAARYLAAYVLDDQTPRPRSGIAPASLMRFCADDLKAFYLEAAGAGPGTPSSLQMTDWLWQHTRAGELLQQIRRGSPASADRQRQAVGEKSLVPERYC